MHIRSLAIGLCAVAVFGCTTHIRPTAVNNPAPAERFGTFDHFELTDVAVSDQFEDNDANQRARAKIQENLVADLKPKLQTWDGKGSMKGRTLRIEPRIEQLKFVSIGDRIMVGAMAGSSAVLMRVRYRDAATGRVIAEPEFYQRAGAARHSFGVSDNLMLNSIADQIASYTVANYDAAVGGSVSGP